MKPSKLKTIHVVIIASVACLMVVVGLYFLVIKKSNESIAVLQAQLDQLNQQAAQKATVEAQLAAEKQKYQAVVWKYNKYLVGKMPPISFEDRANGMIALWKEQSEQLGPMLQAWPNKTGVRLASSISVPAAPVDPNTVATSLVTIPIGTISVVGDFRSILSHVRSWNKFKRLVQIDPVSLKGSSPFMTATYKLTVYIFPRGETGPSVAMAGAGAPGAAGVAPVGGAGASDAHPGYSAPTYAPHP